MPSDFNTFKNIWAVTSQAWASWDAVLSHFIYFFCCWLGSHREHLTKSNVSCSSGHLSILFTSGSTVFFLWRGSTLSHLLPQSYHLMFPLQNNITSHPQQPVQNTEVLHINVSGRETFGWWRPTSLNTLHNYSGMHHSPAALEAERQHQFSSATHLLATHPALLPFSLSLFL